MYSDCRKIIRLYLRANIHLTVVRFSSKSCELHSLTLVFMLRCCVVTFVQVFCFICPILSIEENNCNKELVNHLHLTSDSQP